MKRPTIKYVPDRFCTKCGEPMVKEEVFDHFDPEGGDRLMRAYSTCPNKRWYNNHDRIQWAYKTPSKGKYEWVVL